MAKRTVVVVVDKTWLKHICCSVLIIFLCHQLTVCLASDDKAPTIPSNTTIMDSEANATFLTPIAEQLIRYRRHPPRTIVRHIIRPKRIKVKRVKRPKIKYSFAEPPPKIYYSKGNSKPPMYSAHAPTFDSSIFEDFSHLNVDSPDFDLPASSYETQSMDLDFYKSYEAPAETHYKESKQPSYSYKEPEFTYKEPEKVPSYSYAAPPSSHEERKPHTKYGVPTDFMYSTGYDKPTSGYSYAYQPPSSYEPSKVVEKPLPEYSRPVKDEYSYSKPVEPPRIPATKYGVPDVHIPPPNYGDYHKYELIDQKGPESYESFESVKPNNKHHFAEPPPPGAHQPSVEIMYSPSYEINIPPSEEKYHPDFESEHPQEYDPPPKYQHQPSGYQESADSHQPASYEPAPSQDLPINHNHKHPTYDYPKSSYEVPIYDPIPFDSSNNREQEVYPPQPFDNTSWQEASNTEYAAEPNNVSEQKPSEESSMESQSESFESAQQDTHSAGTRPQGQTTDITRRPHRNRHRKRPKGSSTTSATTKHILDVPELQEAFENEKRHNYHANDADINESHKVINVNSGPWNPMRIRTPPISVTTPATTLPVNQYHGHGNVGRNPYHQQRPRVTTTTTTHKPPSHTQANNHIPNVEIISIEKSRSKTYYDGILSTPKIYNTNFFRHRYKTAATHPTSTLPAPPANGGVSSRENFSKRTTKNVFDTTIFKSPLTDRDVYRNLPKNHKLF